MIVAGVIIYIWQRNQHKQCDIKASFSVFARERPYGQVGQERGSESLNLFPDLN